MDSWEQYKDVLRTLYYSKDRNSGTLRSIMAHMEAEYSFVRSKGQYERQFKKWSFRKNSTSENWQIIHGKIQKRQNQGKKSAVYRSGRLVQIEKLNKEKRHISSKFDGLFNLVRSDRTAWCVETRCRDATVEPPNTPEGYAVCTPMGGDTAPPLYIHNLPSLQLFHQLKSFVSSRMSVSHHPSQRNTDNLGGRNQVASTGTDSHSHLFLDKQVSTSVSAEESILAAISGEEDRNNDGDLEFALLKAWKPGDRNLQDLFQISHTGEISPLVMPMLHRASNNLLFSESASNVVDLICLGGGRRVFNALISTQSPATQAIARSLLPAAIRSQDVELVRSLLNTGVGPDAPVNSARERPLQLAALGGSLDMARLLLSYGAQVEMPWAPGTSSPLIYATVIGHLDLVQLLLEAGADVNIATDQDDRTPLRVAARGGKLELVQLLLKAGADVNAPARGLWGRTALQEALEFGNVAIAQVLVIHGADVNAPASKYRCTALQLAALGGDVCLTALILGWGATDITSALDSASDSQVVHMLLRFEVELDAASGVARDRMALRAAVRCGDLQLVHELLLCGVDADAPADETCTEWTTALQEAAALNNIDAVHLLLEFGADVNAEAAGEDQKTAIQGAVATGNLELVRLLLDAGADPDARSWDGTTPLIEAASCELLEIGQLLLDRGADILEQGKSAIEEAMAHFPGCREFVKMILDFSLANVEGGCQYLNVKITILFGYHAKDIELIKLLLDHHALDKSDALGKAAFERDLELVKLLLSFGADVNAGDALEAAAQFSELEIIRTLIAHGANARTKTQALQAVRPGQLEVMKVLLRSGADINAPPLPLQWSPGQSRTALQRAAECGDLDSVLFLLEEGAEVERQVVDTNDQGTALQYAAISGSISVAKELIQRGANVNAAPLGENGRTALEGAAEHGRVDMVQLLLNLEAETRGSRALRFARREGHDGVAMLLLQNGFEDDVRMSS